MTREDFQTASGLTLPLLLTLVFLVLRLTGAIGWGWIWVFSPIWIEFCLLLAVTLLYIVTFAIRSRRH